MTVVIFANGDLFDIDWVEEYMKEATFVIAANGGLRHLERIGRWPNLIIGDLDSTKSERLKVRNDASIIRKRENKDETDLELALIHATQHFTEEIMVFGAMGGRIDQTLANAMLLAHPRLRSRKITLMGRGQKAWLASSSETILGSPGDIISLIPLDRHVHIKTTTGLKWPLQSENLVMGASRGVSNELTADKAEIKLSDGLLFCVHLDQNWRYGS